MEKTNVRHTAILGLLVAIGLIIFTVESLIPPLVPIPGIKLGLANIITLFTLYAFSGRDAAAVLILRILLASVFAGQIVSFWYSLSGGILCLAAMNIAKKFLSSDYMEFTSVIGGLFHNIGQLAAAVFLMESKALFWYLPVLALGGMICGLFTGIVCKIVFKRLKIIYKNKGEQK